MKVVVEIWCRPKRQAEYRRIGTQLLPAMPSFGEFMSVVVHGETRRVIVDRASRSATGTVPGGGMVWVTEA